MAYQIVRISPVYDSRDSIRGSKARHLPNAYETLALAHRIAGRMEEAGFDDSFVVVPYGKSAFSDQIYPANPHLAWEGF